MTIFNPLTFFWLFAAIILLLYKFGRMRAMKIMLWISGILFFIVCVSPLPIYLMRNLETTYKTYKGNDKLPILVLGNNHCDAPDLFPNQQLSVHSLERVSEGVRIYKSFSGGPIAFSGYAINRQQPTAKVMAEAALIQGVQPKDTIMLTTPSSTWEEAIEWKKRFGTKQRFILITSAAHLPRAMAIFESMEMHPIPAPADYFIKTGTDDAIYNWYPSSFKLLYTEMAGYEHFLGWYYRRK